MTLAHSGSFPILRLMQLPPRVFLSSRSCLEFVRAFPVPFSKKIVVGFLCCRQNGGRLRAKVPGMNGKTRIIQDDNSYFDDNTKKQNLVFVLFYIFRSQMPAFPPWLDYCATFFPVFCFLLRGKDEQ